ncbi:alpha/beta hydrolase [Luteipulveratus sp. YIM 133132]|uniref:alpha/beta fold hydrolase n=1 Tax=Luteipulveratus flavus TaxID=3031728 RepID=UPI0023B1C156|nr:alpha/beta hydrolase [Luteipulveratus sp. YIM 133132]MDE9367740.1 alpha/beta hydrolase [Luteipulveratus sp. YIM 133132]
MATAPDDLTVSVIDGPGPTLVLLHGFLDAGSVWADAVRRWSAYRLLVPDARGHGTSARLTPEQAKPTAAPVMIEDVVRLLEAVVAQHGSKVALVGHSMGAGVAAGVGAARPDLVDALVLEDPAWMPPERARGWRDVHPAQEWAQEFRDDFDATLAAAHAEHPTWPADLRRDWGRAKTRIDPLLKHTGQCVARTPWTETAAALTVPTLLVTGDQPDSTVDRVSVEMLEAVANPQIVVHEVTDAGHYVRLDNPVGYHEVVDPFLAETLAG